MSKRHRSRLADRKPKRDFLTGQVLIAMPNMTDPRFERSIMIVCAHDADHAMAVIVNKPIAKLELGELLDQLDIDPREGVGGEPVYYGGPVQSERGVVLHTLDYRLECTLMINAEVGLTASREILIDIGGRDHGRTAPSRFITAVGYAGWGAGQLEDELSANAWAHCPPDASLVFSDNAGQAWSNALERIGVTGAMLSGEWLTSRSPDAPLN